jgi:hypothetical protein
VPGLLLYSAYYWAPAGEGPGYVRFFVSVFPPLILSALAILCHAMRARLWWWEVGIGVFVAVVATANLREATRTLDRQMDHLLFAKETTDKVCEKLKDGDVVLAANRILNFVEFAGNYRLYAQETFERGAIQNTIKVLKDDKVRPFQRRKAEKLAETQGGKTDSELTQAQRDLVSQQLADGHNVTLILPDDGYRRMRGRLGEKFDLDPVAEWTEYGHSQTGKDGEVRYTSWALYEVRLRTSKSTGAPELQERIDRMDATLRDERADYDTRYPGAQQAWKKVQDLEHELHDLQGQLKKAKAKRPPPSASKATAVTANASSPTPATNLQEVKCED